MSSPLPVTSPLLPSRTQTCSPPTTPDLVVDLVVDLISLWISPLCRREALPATAREVLHVPPPQGRIAAREAACSCAVPCCHLQFARDPRWKRGVPTPKSFWAWWSRVVIEEFGPNSLLYMWPSYWARWASALFLEAGSPPQRDVFGPPPKISSYFGRR